MKIINLTSENSRAVEQTAIMLMDGFRDTGSTSWRNIDDALSEVSESFQPNRISRITVDETGNAQGWIGGVEGDDWELHHLVMRGSILEWR